MPSRPATIVNEQTLQVNVAGPGDARNLYIVSGLARCELNVVARPEDNEEDRATFAAHVGPELSLSRFRRATGSAAITGWRQAGTGTVTFEVLAVDADFDDEAGRVELRFELEVRASGTPTTSVAINVFSVAFQVQTLAT
jgi:hypothetical protein